MLFLHKILAQSAKLYPEHTALIEPNQTSVNYQTFFNNAQDLAVILQKQGIIKGDRVAIVAEKNIVTTTLVFALLMAGAVYVPIDPVAPLSRVAFILDDCKVKFLIFDNSVLPAFDQQYLSEAQQLTSATPEFQIIQYYNTHGDTLKLADNLAYILYTSGSTGQPKGVMLSHQNILSFVGWASNTLIFNSSAVFSSIAPLHFDLSIFDLYVALHQGSEIVLMTRKMVANPLLISTLIEKYSISMCYATPTFFKLMLSYGKMQRFDHSSIQTVLYAGEVFSINALKNLKRIWSQANFYNLYGPTETNVCTYYKIPKQFEQQKTVFPIGKSCSHLRCQLWNQKIRAGAIGELMVSGIAVTEGYVNNGAMNSTAFFIDENGVRWYKTGDWVEVNEQLDFVYLSRQDRMVKKHGYRIELDEVEFVLHKHTSLQEVGVIAQTTPNGEIEISAFIKKFADGLVLSSADLKQFCLEYLPYYMLPDSFIFIEDFPQTSTQKIDYQMLKAMVI